ncbi:unnamed protein product [Effrenium voratum]|uniref:Uncharacterized protein n=1 Tax=Effrenium voratum TaxID=2562239 RepID=A0AA36JT75_9DINO|nr:unnamed protein product [Effrenium voratum]CAJ1427460.1 unnamed protein product [Effrenium voratum]
MPSARRPARDLWLCQICSGPGAMSGVFGLGGVAPKLGAGVWIAPGACVIGDVTLEEGASVWFNCVLRGDDAQIQVGARTNIQDLTLVHLDKGIPCSIGRNVSVGHACILHGCTIEDDVLVGMGATVLNKAVIGRGSIVGAGSVVLEGTQVPPFSLVVGSPAQVKKTYKEEDRLAAQRKHADGYVQKAARFRSQLQPSALGGLRLAGLLGVACVAAICVSRR